MDALNIHDVDKADTSNDERMDSPVPLRNPPRSLLVEEYWAEIF